MRRTAHRESTRRRGSEPVEVTHTVWAGTQHEGAGGALRVDGVVNLDGGVVEGRVRGKGEEVG